MCLELALQCELIVNNKRMKFSRGGDFSLFFCFVFFGWTC